MAMKSKGISSKFKYILVAYTLQDSESSRLHFPKSILQVAPFITTFSWS